MGGYSYSFMAKGFEKQGERSWKSFEQNLKALSNKLDGIPFAMLISPISPMVHPNLPEHHVALPIRMDCATADPVEKLYDLSLNLGFSICNPTAYLTEVFHRYREEGNTRTLFHENDENHPNETGSLLIGEYCYEHLFRQENILERAKVSGNNFQERKADLGYRDFN